MKRGSRRETDTNINTNTNTNTKNTHPSQNRRRMGHPQDWGRIRRSGRVVSFARECRGLWGLRMEVEKGWATRPPAGDFLVGMADCPFAG